MNEHEVFGPVATVGPYSGDPAFAAEVVARGEGCLVSSAYWRRPGLGRRGSSPRPRRGHGRLYLGSSKMAAQSPGPGTALPRCSTAGPGRAGGGERARRRARPAPLHAALRARGRRERAQGARRDGLRRLLGSLALVAVLAGLVLGVLIWQDAARRRDADKRALDELREETRQLVQLCALEGFGGRIDLGTGRFGAYFATDRAQARRVLADVVGPVLDAQELACSSAKADIERYERDGERDRWIEQARPKVGANVATLARVRAAYDALAASLAANADAAELAAKLGALRAAARTGAARP